MNIQESNSKQSGGLSVVIAAYNEEKRIGPTLDDTIEYCLEHLPDYEVIIVDDGSTDKTASIVRAYEHKKVRLIQVEKNTGKGNGVRVGMLEATKPFVLFMDADGATHIREIEKLFPRMLMGDVDIVIGTRKIKTAQILKKQGFVRRFMGGFFTILSRLVTRTNFSDYMCGFKLFKTDVAKKLATLQTTKRFTFDTEYLGIARQRNMIVVELPITWEDKAGSKVRKVSDTLSSLGDLAKIAFHLLLGTYRR